MRWLYLTLFVYCIIALVVTGWVSSVQFRAIANARQQFELSLADLELKSGREAELKQHWLDLDNAQRVGRADFDGPAAVDSSFNTQQALEAYRIAEKRRKQAQAVSDEWNTKERGAKLNLFPLFIGGLIHLIGLFALWPGRDNRRTEIRQHQG